MSKLAQIQTFRNAPAAGGLFSFIPKLLGGAVNAVTGLNIIKPKSTAPATAATVATAVPSQTAAVKALMGGGSFGVKRRSKGISGRELKGFRKVAKLLHKEGMVSKKSRGR
jgi:septal ring-binding cell division protein DamX